MQDRRRRTTAAALAAATVLGGCASFNNLSSDVSTYSQWPAGRKPATYTFDRLPSQQAQPETQQRLEEAARNAIAAAGFAPAADGANADVTIQLGARVNATERSPWDDPFWWHGGIFYGRHGGAWRGPGWGWGWGMHYRTPSYEREVAVLIRDRGTGAPLYESRATNDGPWPGINALLPAMFAAALKDFPNSGINSRRVVTPISPQ